MGAGARGVTGHTRVACAEALQALARLATPELLDGICAAILVLERDGRIAVANTAAERLFGSPVAALSGRPVVQWLPEWHVGAPGAHHAQRAHRHDGSTLPVEVARSPVDVDGQVYWICAVRDTSASEHLERQLQNLCSRVLHAQEEERKRVARELHDDVTQRLALLCLEMDLLGQSCPSSLPETRQQIEQVGLQIRQISSELHDLSHELHPSKLEYLGLLPALRSLCQDVEKRNRLRVDLVHRAVPTTLDAPTRLCLYRIAQQALANVVEHSGADTARVELVCRSRVIHLRVIDAGIGFDPTAAAGGGLGLLAMSERARLVGGQVSITSRPGHGTRIAVRIPLKQRPPDGRE